jgi:hypothetical protein
MIIKKKMIAESKQDQECIAIFKNTDRQRERERERERKREKRDGEREKSQFEVSFGFIY